MTDIGVRSRPTAPSPLRDTVLYALHALDRLAQLADRHRPEITDVRRRLDHLLRTSLTRHQRAGARHDRAAPDPAPAVLAACAHLAAGAHEDAYLALSTALDLMPPGRPRQS